MSDLYDVVAERQLLSVALRYGAIHDVMSVPVAAYAGWQTHAVAIAVHDLHARGNPVDPPVVLREVLRRAGTDRQQQMGKVVTDLATNEVPPSSAPYYAERITAMHAAREVATASETFRNAVDWAAENDDETALGEATRAMRRALDDAETAFQPTAAEAPMSLHDLLMTDDEPYDWLVPGLFERGDRAIVTGFEGLGKSYLLAQFALCIGAGIHPFSRTPLGEDKYRVLIFDVENSTRQLRRRYRRIAGQVEAIIADHGLRPVDWSECVRIVSRPEGVALTHPRELARIEQSITATGPDLVLAGPLYKMSSLDIRDEQAALELCNTLDVLRVRHRFTLVAEAHAGHSSDGAGSRRVRPIGSSVFLRWPEFGFGIAPNESAAHMEHPNVVDLRHWRGGRDDRHWPRQLCHGDFLPWEPNNRDYWDQPGGAA